MAIAPPNHLLPERTGHPDKAYSSAQRLLLSLLLTVASSLGSAHRKLIYRTSMGCAAMLQPCVAVQVL